MKHSLIAVCVMVMWMVGCGAQPGTSVVKYDKGSPARMSEAPANGTYSLYSAMGTNPDVTYELKKGDKLGFAEADGKVWAVAGDNKDELKLSMMKSTYYWKMKE